VLKLTPRQTLGFLATRLLPGQPVPYYSTLCRRALGLEMPVLGRRPGPVHLVVNSTGLKVFGEGEGEWRAR